MIQPVNCYENEGNQAVLSAIPSSAKKIVDLGCGAGNIGKKASKREIVWDGVTISVEEAAAAKKHYRNVVLHDLEKGLPPQGLDREYDVCICSHVIEHIVWPQKLLGDIRELLSRTNGLLIMAVPNFVNHEIRMKILRGKFEYRPSGILDINHVRWYTFKSAQRLLIQNGFTITKAWAEGNFPVGKKLRKKRLAPGLFKAIDRFACRRFPGLFGFELLYTAKPAPASSSVIAGSRPDQETLL